MEGSDAVRDVVCEPQSLKPSAEQAAAVPDPAPISLRAEEETSQSDISESESGSPNEKLISWESLRQRLLEHLNQHSEDKALAKLLETLVVESRADGFCVVCSNKAEHTLLLEKLPRLQELINRLAAASGIKISATVKDVPASLTKPKPVKPAEIREAMAEKNPALLKFIEQLNLKLD